MTSGTIHGVHITPARAAACRELLAGVASAAAWAELAPLIAESERRFVGVSPESDGEGKRHPPFGELDTVEGPPLRALASCALGSACARCSAPIEQEHDVAAVRRALETDGPLPPLSGEELGDGWCCPPCVARQREQEAFRRRAARWLRRGNQMGLFGVEPAKARRRRR